MRRERGRQFQLWKRHAASRLEWAGGLDFLKSAIEKRTQQTIELFELWTCAKAGKIDDLFFRHEAMELLTSCKSSTEALSQHSSIKS